MEEGDQFNENSFRKTTPFSVSLYPYIPASLYICVLPNEPNPDAAEASSLPNEPKWMHDYEKTKRTQIVEKWVSFTERTQSTGNAGRPEFVEGSLTFAICLFPFTFFISVSSENSEAKFKNDKTNPIFSRPIMRYQYQKRGNGGQKLTQKNETNPFVDNFEHPERISLYISSTRENNIKTGL